MLIEELFPGHHDHGAIACRSRTPGRSLQSRVYGRLPALRSAEMEKFRWIAGEWNHENAVPVTRVSPAYTDVGSSRFSICENGNWVCAVRADGREVPLITFDPFSRQWMYVITNGAYCTFRSSEGWTGERIVFTGLMTMIGINCEWRLTPTSRGPLNSDSSTSSVLKTAPGCTSTSGASATKHVRNSDLSFRRRLQVAQAALEVPAHHAVHVHQNAH